MTIGGKSPEPPNPKSTNNTKRKRSSSKTRLSSAPSEAKKSQTTAETAAAAAATAKRGTITKASDRSSSEKKRPLPKFSLYGKICNVGTDNGTVYAYFASSGDVNRSNGDDVTDELKVRCSGCQGAKDSKLPKNHPILLCDGHGCKREYHLHCTPQLLNEVPDGPFYCPDCDPHGNSATLNNYFDSIDDLRGLFDTSRELVNFLLCLHAKGIVAKQLLPEYIRSSSPPNDEKDEAAEKRSSGNHIYTNNRNSISEKFGENSSSKEAAIDGSSMARSQVDKLIEVVAPDAVFADGAKDNVAKYHGSLDMLEASYVPQSELLRAYELHCAALKEPPSLSSYFPSSGDSKKVVVDSIQDKSKEVKSEPEKKSNFIKKERLGPEILVGKIVRLYCPTDNQYHHGRVIDWRSIRSLKEIPARLSADLLYSNNDDIGKSEFLVRFPGGLDGRKTTVQRWIVLEEHSVAVSMSMIMAQRDKGRGLNGWKPAQTVLRTRIELLPIKQYLRQDGLFALAIFFGKDNHFYLDLENEAADLFSPKFEQRRLDRLLVPSNTPNTKTAYVQSVEAQMDLAMSLVKIELEEQKRTFRWHKLMLDDFAHPKCFSMKSEFGLPPLEIVEETCINGTGGELIESSSNKNGEEGEILDVREIQPNLCQLIQFGLDRQEITSKITAMTGREFTLDAIASMRCSVGKSRAEKIALLKGRL